MQTWLQDEEGRASVGIGKGQVSLFWKIAWDPEEAAWPGAVHILKMVGLPIRVERFSCEKEGE